MNSTKCHNILGMCNPAKRHHQNTPNYKNIIKIHVNGIYPNAPNTLYKNKKANTLK